MNIKTALLKIFVLSIFIFLPSFVFAQSYEVTNEDVTVNANINVDLYSTLELQPSSVEVNQPSTVTVRVVSPVGVPIPNHEIVITGDGLNISQPITRTDITGKTTGTVSSSLPGTYTVCAKDITFGYDIAISNCKTLYVIPVPTTTLLAEPYYTKGNSNNVLWNSLGSNYSYTAQVSRYSDFRFIKYSTGWINNTSYEFSNLENEVMYFYRVKSRNIFGGESDWSGYVFSVQDSENPNISVLEIGSVESNNTVDWDSADIVTLKFVVTDNLELDTTQFICINTDGSTNNCSQSGYFEGNNYIVNIRLGSLERVSGVYLLEKYNFCVEAKDKAGNVSRMCDIYLTIPKGSTTPEEPGEEEKPPISKPTIIDRIEKNIDDLNVVLDNTIGNIDSTGLQTVSTTTGVVTISTAIALAAGGIWEIPYLITQLVLTLLSWLGFRKEKKPFGYIYDSITKEPISQAIVRIFDENGRMVWSDVTDMNGYFNANIQEGIYRIKVRSSRYSFPSNIVFGKEDYPLSNIYHGEEFEINSDGEVKYNIPLDPVEISQFRNVIESLLSRSKVIMNILHFILFVIGLVFSVYAYSRYPSTLNLIIMLLFLPSIFLVFKNIFTKNVKYGYVRDKEGNPLSNVVIGLRDVEFEKIVYKRVTDKNGKYRFVVDDGIYELEVLETGYKVISVKEGAKIEVRKKNTLIAKDIVLEEVKK